jgi:hypothetical protein
LGLVPKQTVAPTTAGALWKNEEGNVVSVREAHALVAEAPKKRVHVERHVLHSVQRPVHVYPGFSLTSFAERAGRGGRFGIATHVRRASSRK